MPSIHEIEEGLAFESLPPVDSEDRSILADRVLDQDVTASGYEGGRYDPVHDWSLEELDAALSVGEERVEIRMIAAGPVALTKTISFGTAGHVEVRYEWDPAGFPPGAFFAPELSLEHDPGVLFDPAPESVWRHEIVTWSKSEAGAEESMQGLSVTPRWPVGLGAASLVIPAASISPSD